MATPPDPIVILILVAANGYANDIAAAVAPLSRDPDLWSYLVKCRLGRVGYTFLHAAAALGHTEMLSFLCAAGAEVSAVTTHPCRLARHS